MSDFNSVVLMGNMVRDPQLRNVGQYQLAEFSLACNPGKKGDPAVFMDCELWGKQSETLMQYTGRGSKLIVTGKLIGKEWTGKDGTKKSKVVVRCDGFTMMGRPQNGGGGYVRNAPTGQQSSSPYGAADRPPAQREPFNPDDGDSPIF